LSQLQLVALPHPSNDDKDGESIDQDQNHISVEIMSDNMALLESIVAGDDSTLANVRYLKIISLTITLMIGH
jgi:hypothetical protein